LKTPNGKTFLVESEALAHAVANEWLAQKDTIMLSQMHINALCNTCIDNPGRTDKNKLVESILGKQLHIRKLPNLHSLTCKRKWYPVKTDIEVFLKNLVLQLVV
jgi:chaperone required for assembly of F1-ATPase